MPAVTIIADDLTGAADCGIAFASAGLATFVAFRGDAAPPGVDVAAIDSDTRRLGEADAVARVRAAVARAYRGGARVLYRKLDSTLRGHVGAELAGTLAGFRDARRDGRPLVVLAPAFPGTGRITRGGRVLVKGVPLEETEVWRDARIAGPADPAAMLAGAGLSAAVVTLDEVRAGPAALARALAERGAAVDAVVCDAEEEADLRAVAEAGARQARPVVWAGSAGIARHLPAALGLRGSAAAPRAAEARRGGQIAIVVGSRSSVAREQARAVAGEGGVASLALAPDALLDGGAAPAEALERAFAAGGDVLVGIDEAFAGAERGPALAAAVARLVAPHASGLAGVVATGGDMARALLEALGGSGILLVGEVEPGVPLGLADVAPPLPVVTKAGAFGSPATLSRARAAVRAFARGNGPGGWERGR